MRFLFIAMAKPLHKTTLVTLTNLGTEKQPVYVLAILNVILIQTHDCVRTIHGEFYLQLQLAKQQHCCTIVSFFPFTGFILVFVD